MNEFGSNVERHRRELLVHCYRMLGSLPDAEDAVQETSLRAWRYRDSLKEGAPLRPWLYRVATNACLDAIARDERRAVLAARAAADEGGAGELEDVVWLGPIPDSVLEPSTPPARTPEAMTLMRETIEIAFLTVIQLLTPQQRAALILCDVLDWSAKDAADLLDISVSAVNSALQRARARLRERLPSHKPAWPASVDASAAERDLLKKYVEAGEAADFRALESIIRADATFRMPPQPDTAAGREAMFKLWIEGGFGSEQFGQLRCVVTHANLQPAVAAYPARRFHLAGPGAGCSSNRGRLDHGDRDVPAGHFPTLRAADIDGRGAGDEDVSLIYSMLGEVRSFSATPAVADRREGDPVTRWSPYFLSILRIIAAFVYGVHGTQKLFGFPAPFPVPHLPPLFVAGGLIETFGGLLLLIGLFTRPFAFVLSGEMAVAYFKFHAPQGFWPLLNDGEGAVLYCFIFLFLASAGGGPWSFDRLLRKRASTV